MSQLTFLSEEHHARNSLSPVLGVGFPQKEETSHLSLYAWLKGFAQKSFFGKMFSASCHLTEDGILVPSSAGWGNSGMGSLTGFLTLNTSECHKDAAVCSLSAFLETGLLPPKYFLSQRACKGILRRYQTDSLFEDEIKQLSDASTRGE